MLQVLGSQVDHSHGQLKPSMAIALRRCRAINPQTDEIKNYKSLFVHGSVVDIMAIQIHFRYRTMITRFFPIKQTSESDMSGSMYNITNSHLGMYGV